MKLNSTVDDSESDGVAKLQKNGSEGNEAVEATLPTVAVDHC